jgi:hypothetical protein
MESHQCIQERRKQTYSTSFAINASQSVDIYSSQNNKVLLKQSIKEYKFQALQSHKLRKNQ